MRAALLVAMLCGVQVAGGGAASGRMANGLSKLGRGFCERLTYARLAAAAPVLETLEEEDACARLEAHLGQAVNQRQRHNRLSRHLEEWLRGLGAAEMRSDTALARLPWAAGLGQKSRKPDIVVTTPSGRVIVIEITVAWDGKVAARSLEKQRKYADLGDAGAGVLPVKVVALGALGHVPEETVSALGDVARAMRPEGGRDWVAAELQDITATLRETVLRCAGRAFSTRRRSSKPARDPPRLPPELLRVDDAYL